MSDIILAFDAYCTKFELDPGDKQSEEMYTTYKENVESSDTIFNANSDANVQGKDALFD